MASKLIDEALQSATDTRAIAFGSGVVKQTGKIFTECFPGKRAIVIADENTFAAAGEATEQSLRDAGVELEESYVLPGKPVVYAGYANVEKVREHLKGVDAIAVAIASGTLNDIVKLASGELGREYLNVCTAASMDGYASFGASITRDGFKITRDCPAPAALVADLDVMAAAPKHLTATGYGDLIEKIPGGADWIIADELGIEAIDDAVWAQVQGPLRDALSDPEGCKNGVPEALSGLAEGLLMSGLAMQAYESSRPASGAGHNFSHQWEMEGHGQDWDLPLSHGKKVGLGTIATCALYEKVMALDIAGVDTDAALEAWPDAEANDERVKNLQPVDAIREAALKQSRAKHLSPEELRERVELIKDRWAVIQDRLIPQLVTADEAAEMLKKVGAPYHPGMVGIDQEKLKLTYYQSQTIRSRYTVMDMLQELGLLDQVIESVFQPGGYWHEHPEPEDS